MKTVQQHLDYTSQSLVRVNATTAKFSKETLASFSSIAKSAVDAIFTREIAKCLHNIQIVTESLSSLSFWWNPNESLSSIQGFFFFVFNIYSNFSFCICRCWRGYLNQKEEWALTFRMQKEEVMIPALQE